MSGRVARLLLAGFLVTIVGAGVVWLGGDRLMHRLEGLPQEWSADNPSRVNSTRLDVWRATLAMIQDHPITGVGFGGYRVSLPQYHDASGRWIPQEAHNDYLELMASGGIVAVSLMLIFAILFIKQAQQCLNNTFEPFGRAACFGALVGLLGVAIHSLVDFSLHTTLNATVCIALIVIATRTIAPGTRTTTQFSN